MTSSVVPLKQSNTQSSISLEILEQCSLNLTPDMNISRETKRRLSCCCHDYGYAVGRVLIKSKIPRFYLKQGSSTPNSLMGRVKTIWEPCVFRPRSSVPFQRVSNVHIWFLTERDWSQECCHGNNIVGVILFLL